MDAESSVELGCDDARLEMPWRDPSGRLVYCDLRRSPASAGLLPEVLQLPELGELLLRLNAPESPFASAKCDLWREDRIEAHEVFFEGDGKLCCYVDLLFAEAQAALREDFELHEQLAGAWAGELDAAPGEASAEIVLRRCLFREPTPVSGYYWTVYLRGFGGDEARRRSELRQAMSLFAEAALGGTTRSALEVRGFLR